MKKFNYQIGPWNVFNLMKTFNYHIGPWNVFNLVKTLNYQIGQREPFKPAEDIKLSNEKKGTF